MIHVTLHNPDPATVRVVALGKGAGRGRDLTSVHFGPPDSEVEMLGKRADIRAALDVALRQLDALDTEGTDQ